jgi:hypothetical protein
VTGAVGHAQRAVGTAEGRVALANRLALRAGHTRAATIAVLRIALTLAITLVAIPTRITLTVRRPRTECHTRAVIVARGIAVVVAAVSAMVRRIASAHMHAESIDDTRSPSLAHVAVGVERQTHGLRAVGALEARVTLAVLRCRCTGVALHLDTLTRVAALIGTLDHIASRTRPMCIAATTTVAHAHAVTRAAGRARLGAAITTCVVLLALTKSLRCAQTMSSAVVEARSHRAILARVPRCAGTLALDARTRTAALHRP